MPELPDITVYIERLAPRVIGQSLEQVRLASPFLVRSVEPPISDAHGRTVEALGRIGKRIVFHLQGDLHLVLHLMISGRIRWKKKGFKPPRKNGLAALDFPAGTLSLTEASSRKRASLYAVAGREGLAAHDRGGIEVMTSTPEAFGAALRSRRHTLKRSMTDQRILSGIGNAYSDEILHRAKLSPFKLAPKLDDDEIARLHAATLAVITHWTELLRAEVGDGFPDKVTAFHDGMAVHGKYRQPCPVCAAPVQRIRYADNEANYCPGCQTGGRLLADRSLSRLLKQDWPKRLEDLEEGSPFGVKPVS